MATQQGITYDTAQEGPFYRVRPHGVASGFAATRGNIESHRDTGQGQQGLSRDTVPQPLTDEAVKGIIKGPDNAIRHAAEAYTKQHLGKPYKPVDNSSSSLAKQGAIGRTFLLAATDHPEYKKAVYEAYKRHMPEHVGEAQDYDQLLQKAYGHLAHETKRQFESLPINMSFHRNGEGNYQDSKEMIRDVHGHRHLYVFQGGDRHDFLHNVHPESGLNDNEMFRAVHDVYGHALHGTTFGPQGEEKAWAAHSGMFSPLAQAAMTAETRGQNSVVNYTPLNARIKAEVAALDETAYDAKRKGRMDLFEAAKAEKKNLLDNHFQFAPQRAVLLPPEMNSGSYAGGIPAYIRHLIQPEGGETAQLTHFSHEPNLTMTDPTRYGTGIKGAEASRLQEPGAVRDRTYFYAGNPERGEVGLGTHKYKAMVDKLYDMGADPLMLRKLAVEANRTPHTSMVNPGLVDQVQAANDYERLIKDYGYNGMINRNLSMPTAAVFNPVPVQKYADGNSVKPVKASEALGQHEGKYLMATQADRTKIGNKQFRGGARFSALQHMNPEYENAAWGVMTPGMASTLIGANKRVPEGQAVWSTLLGTPEQHTSNPVVFDALLKPFHKAVKEGMLEAEHRVKMNKRLAGLKDKEGTPLFDPNVDIGNKAIREAANTFNKRRAVADLIGGIGVGGKKGQIIDYNKIVHQTTEPSLRDLPTHSIGPRLFQLNNETSYRPELNAAFPHILHGQDLGHEFQPVPKDVMLRDFITNFVNRTGRKPGYFDLTMGHAPAQHLSEDFLTHLQKLGYAKGGNVEPTIDEMQAALALRKPHMAAGGQPKNPFDYENPEHVANVVKIAAQHKLLAPITDVHKHLADILSGGHYKHIEDPNIQNAIRQAGHDAYYVAEKSGKQSHILNKADGGDVAIKDVGAEEAPNLGTKEFILPHGQHPGQLPVGGVDMQPAVPGQQLMPQQPGQQPPQGGQLPQGGPAPQGPQPTSLSNILQMTPQGRAMGAMQPQQPQQAKKGGTIKPVGRGITKEKVTISPNLDAMQYELMSVKHFKKAK